ncbi:hypothetical protein [Nonomuraea sediminis]|uniref:hypothetical protein n=1 Tax=Nonomuraea sediminis TaxID=2835864 RepID=UPI001BDC5602|nr:hypothetical protein [Nonomuraea sediminis]
MRVLRIAAAFEALSLVVLLVNLFTVHAKPVSSLVGSLHGMSYVAVIAAASMTSAVAGVRWLAWIPGIGGALALRRLRSANET